MTEIKTGSSEACEILKEFIDGKQDFFSSYALKTKESSLEETSLLDKLDDYSKSTHKLIEEYLNTTAKKNPCLQNGMMLFNTWNQNAKRLSLPNQNKNAEFSDGLFIRWAGKGIAINPGSGFLESLYKKNFSVLDIDAIIVTHSRHAFQEIVNIYELSSAINTQAGKPHVIDYYFNRLVYQEMIQILKPRYRQEKSTLQCLEIYLDTPDVESIDLGQGIRLGYFLTSPAFNPLHPTESLNLGIKLELQEGDRKRSIAYVSSCPWSPLLQQQIGNSDFLIVGFGTTKKTDLEKERYLDEALGYFGTLTLLQETLPRLAFITEFDQQAAGARLEIIKQIRDELAQNGTIVLPGDPDLFIGLDHGEIQCTVTQEWIDPHVAKIVQGVHPLGGLQFLSPKSYI